MGYNKSTDNIITALILLIVGQLLVISVIGTKLNDTNRRIEIVQEQIEQLEKVYE